MKTSDLQTSLGCWKNNRTAEEDSKKPLLPTNCSCFFLKKKNSVILLLCGIMRIILATLIKSFLFSQMSKSIYVSTITYVSFALCIYFFICSSTEAVTVK